MDETKQTPIEENQIEAAAQTAPEAVESVADAAETAEAPEAPECPENPAAPENPETTISFPRLLPACNVLSLHINFSPPPLHFHFRKKDI